MIEYLKPPKIRSKAKIAMLADQIKEVRKYEVDFVEPIKEFDEQLAFELGENDQVRLVPEEHRKKLAKRG